MGFSINAVPGHNSGSGNSNVEINRLSSELNSRLSREMDEMISSVDMQIQRAISDAARNQILPQIHNASRSGSGHLTQNRWNVPAERPEIDSKLWKTTAVVSLEIIREVSPSGDVLMLNPQTKLTTVTYSC